MQCLPWAGRGFRDQAYGRGDNPMFTTGVEPLERLTLNLTDKNTSGD